MEAKVNLVQKVLLFCKSTISQSSPPLTQRFTLESVEHKKDLLKRRLQGLSEDHIRKTWFYCISARDRYQHSFNIWGGLGNHKIFTTLSSHQLVPAKTSCYFLLLLPLLAFCIRCIIISFRHRVCGSLKNQVINEPSAHRHGSRSIHWKTALSDIRDMEVLGCESRQDSINPAAEAEDEAPVSFEEMSDAYTEIEPAYQKFLSDCGMSESGYWRGASPTR